MRGGLRRLLTRSASTMIIHPGKAAAASAAAQQRQPRPAGRVAAASCAAAAAARCPLLVGSRPSFAAAPGLSFAATTIPRPSRALHASASAASAAAADAAAQAAAEAEAEAAREAEQAQRARAAALAALRAGPPTDADAARSASEIIDAIVKVFVTSSRPDQWSPWSNHVRRESTGTGFMIGPGLILTCAHVVADGAFITLRRHGASQRYRAEVVAIGHDVDLALLTVPDAAFWTTPGAMRPLRLAEGVPKLQSRVRVSAYPSGGDNVCVTSGIASRVDVTQYVHSASSFMAIQVDSSINGGASGGPCLAGDTEQAAEDEQGTGAGGDSAPSSSPPSVEDQSRVVGVAFQNVPSGDSQGFIIPMPVVHRFLDEVRAHGRYRGFCSMGIIYSTCENIHLRAYLGMVAGRRPGVPALPPPSYSSDADASPSAEAAASASATDPQKLPPPPDAPAEDLSGVLITTVQPTAAARGILQPGDVLLSFDGINLANDGTVPFRARERIFFTSLVTQKPTGSHALVEVLRGGKKLPEPLKVPLAPLRPLVRVHCYDELPSFYVFAGLVFVPLSQPFLHEWGDGWMNSSPRRLVEKALHGLASVPGEQVVILSQVLVADVNAGYQSLTNLQVLTVDGKKIKDLRALREAILNAPGPFVVLGMEQDRRLVLDLAAARAADAGVLRRYRVPFSTSADLLEDEQEAEEGRVDDGAAVVVEGGDGGGDGRGGAVAAKAALECGAVVGDGGVLLAPAPVVGAAASASASSDGQADGGARVGWA